MSLVTARDFYNAIMTATSTKQVEDAKQSFADHYGDRVSHQPIGDRPNNKGQIEVAADAGRAAMERVTNAQDAILELEHAKHNGLPICMSPREAASSWLGVPEEGLSSLTPKQRRDLAKGVTVRLSKGEDKHLRLFEVHDQGIGMRPNDLKHTILSLGESNKIQKHYLAGVYGQGGSSTFSFSRYSVIASRHYESAEIGFTIVWYLDLPADKFKTGHYVYLVFDGKPLSVAAEKGDFKSGAVVRHFGYDLSNYSAAIGPSSLYGALNRILFNPVTPVWFENKVNEWNRVIKGSRNALHGAVDEGDETGKTKLDHSISFFSVLLGDLGSIGIEYWVLEKPEKPTAKPSAVFVDPKKPIILTFNGQNQGELGSGIIKKDADLPFLKDRLICHITCDRLSHEAKRNLFSSTREQSKSGFVLERITQEITSILKTDDDLRRLNDLARNESLKDSDEDTKQQIRREIAKLLRLAGAATLDTGGQKAKDGDKPGKPIVPRKPRVLEPIPIHEPPTYVRIVWDEDRPIGFYPSQRRYIRIETDANSEYHDLRNPDSSRVNIIAGDELKLFGTTPLKGGRMRAGLDCLDGAKQGTAGKVTVELYRAGLPTLSDTKEYVIVEKPQPKDTGKDTTFPDFQIIEVKGPDDENWGRLSETLDVHSVASASLMNEGTLYVYYSSAFPKFSEELTKLAVRDAQLALSFRLRYEIWIAVHSLLIYQDQSLDDGGTADVDETIREELERKERCRLAHIATVMASREVRMGAIKEGQDENDA